MPSAAPGEMPAPVVYEVAPAADVWLVRMAGDSLSEAYATKPEALSRARHLGVRQGVAVRVLNESGVVEAEYAPPEPDAQT